MTLTLPSDLQSRLRRKAETEGADENALILQALEEFLTDDEDEFADGTAADLFAGRIGVVEGAAGAFSESTGAQFTEYVVAKHEADRG